MFFILIFLLYMTLQPAPSQTTWYLDNNGNAWAGTNLGNVTELHDVDGIKYQLNGYGNATLDNAKRVY